MASDGEKSKKSLPSDNAKASAIREDGAFWSIFAYLISGLVFWGAMGALGDHFLHTGYLIIVGLVIGLSAGLGLIWMRFIRQ
jgi:ATP synthase protein I